MNDKSIYIIVVFEVVHADLCNIQTATSKLASAFGL